MKRQPTPLPVAVRAAGIFIFLLSSLTSAVELLARTPAGGRLPGSVDSGNFTFDIKLAGAEAAARQGRLNCLIVGSSLANNGIDPQALGQAYAARTGQTLDCYNYGLPAITMEKTGMVTRALAYRFQPGLIIVIISPRDLMTWFGEPAGALERSTWVNYWIGDETPAGWLQSFSYTYRMYLFSGYWHVPANRSVYLEERRAIRADGYTPEAGVRQDSPEAEPRDLIIDPSAWDGFVDILNLRQDGVQVIVVEAPSQESAWTCFNLDTESYRDNFQAVVAAQAQAGDAGTISAWEYGQSLPASAWYDDFHLNQEGVEPFSRWLGERIAEVLPGGIER